MPFRVDSWKNKRSKISCYCPFKRVEQLALTKSDTVVMDLLSNTAYLGTNEDGVPLSAQRPGDGTYHIIGTLTTAPPTTIKKNA